jgi:hypothetical protein
LANDELDVRAMTLFANGNIMQLLEGNYLVVNDVFEKLRYDAKQIGIVQLFNKPLTTHCLSETCIGYSSHELEHISILPPNISVFKLQQTEVKKRLTPSPAKALMMQFSFDYG